MLTISIDPASIAELKNSLKFAVKDIDSAVRSSLLKGASFFRRLLRPAVERNEFGWPALSKYPKFFPNAIYSDMKSMISANPATRMKPHTLKSYPTPSIMGFLGKLSRVFRYAFTSRRGEPPIIDVGILPGWVGPKAVHLFEIFQLGQTSELTESRRRYFGALRLPRRRGVMMVRQPPRELIRPAFERYSGEINTLIEQYFYEKIEKLKL